MKRRVTILVVAACTGLLALRAEAQDRDTGYGGSQSVAYYDSDASLEAHIRELEGSLAHYRGIYESSLSGNAAGGCDACDGGCGGCCIQPANWFDCCCCGPTLAFSLGGDAWRDAGDVENNNNFGNRFTLDGTWDLGQRGVRAHVGMAYGLYDYHGRTTRRLASSEQQVFLTAGAYHRGCCAGDWTWGASYDFLNDNHYGQFAESIDLHQVRFLVGRMLNACNEFGVWGAFGIGDDVYVETELSVVEVQDQVNLYWRRYWDFGGETMLYAGVAQPNMVTTDFIQSIRGPAFSDDLTEFVVGLRGIAPLTCNLGVYGGFHYVIPSASGGINGPLLAAPLEENWSVGFGLVWVRGCSLPVLPTADNGWMGKRTFGLLP